MTCVVGLETPKSVWFGGDSATVDDTGMIQLIDTPKVFRRTAHGEEFLFGFSGDFQMGQLTQYAFQIPQPPKKGVFKYLLLDFCGALRHTLAQHGALSGAHMQGLLLVGFRGKVYKMNPDFSILTPVGGFTALGTSDGIALGSLRSTESMKPRDRVQRALEAAEAYHAAVRRPFKILHIRSRGKPVEPAEAIEPSEGSPEDE